MSSKPKVLVIGATGKTGMPVVEQALEAGLDVRAVIRRDDKRAQRLRESGAETVTGDVHELGSVRDLVKGVDRIYLAYPTHLEQLIEATGNVAIAARDEGISGLVNMSQIIAREGARSPLTRQHWLAENILDIADVGAIHIRPSYFMENLLLFAAQSIAKDGKIFLPLGRRKHAPVAARDIARVVVHLLQRPDQHAGQRLVLTGPELLSLDEMADVIAGQLGRPVQYVDLPVEQWRTIMTEQAGLPQYLVTHLCQAALDHQDGLFDRQTDAVERLTGAPPQKLEDFVREHLPLLRGDEVVNRRL
jgi:NAD(P)H dehydrogenase (quinone)